VVELLSFLMGSSYCGRRHVPNVIIVLGCLLASRCFRELTVACAEILLKRKSSSMEGLDPSALPSSAVAFQI
jgi:hypothetical protein